jgi:hypothetical protein
MTKKFTIISGNTSAEELEILNQVIEHHQKIERTPVVKRSNWAQPQMRAPMPQATIFGAGRNV